jgi:hypothetical protein
MPSPRGDLPLYHTALKGAVMNSAPRVHVETGSGIAFLHDIRQGLPILYDSCDVLYTDLPWRAGFAAFEGRAGEPPGASYAGFLSAVGEVVRAERRLTILVTGAHALRLLPDAEQDLGMTLNGDSCIAAVYHGEVPHLDDTVNLLHWLADQYNCIGDFCCGYGRAGRIFKDHEKRFIMSDYNPRCIGYIGDTFH